jgi:tRNA (guanine26-N2/guanine27-N2)-dimethyltransferase
LSRVLRSNTIPMNTFRAALHSLGYRSTRSHTKADSVRTDAPWPVIWEVMREWIRQKRPLNKNQLQSNSPGAAIMRKARDPAMWDMICRSNGPGKAHDQYLAVLKKDVQLALDSCTTVLDLTTKVEAALYRSSVRENWGRWPAPREEQTGPLDPPMQPPSQPLLSELEISFVKEPGKKFTRPISKKKKVSRYPENPRPNWGPMARAK